MKTIALLSLPLVLGCGAPAGTQPGYETAHCIEGSCFDGLECLSNLCVDPNWPAGSGGGETQGEGDGPPADGTGQPSGSTTAEGTSSPPSDDTMTDTTAGGDTTSGVDPTGGENSTGSVDPTNGSTGGESTSTGAGDGGSMGQPSTGMYADCYEGFLDNCTPDASTCLNLQGMMNGFCTALNCVNPAVDCDPSPGGTAPVYCAGSTQTFCALDCSAGQVCPVGMVCTEIIVEAPDTETICI